MNAHEIITVCGADLTARIIAAQTAAGALLAVQGVDSTPIQRIRVRQMQDALNTALVLAGALARDETIKGE